MGLEAGIWASRLEFGPRDWDLRGGDVEEGEGEGENPSYDFFCPSCYYVARGHQSFNHPCIHVQYTICLVPLIGVCMSVSVAFTC